MSNFIFENKELLSKFNYVRKVKPEAKYFWDFQDLKLKKYREKFGDNFNLILYCSELEKGDFYVIPFTFLSQVFVEGTLTFKSKRKIKCWMGDIQYHQLNIRNYPFPIDISEFYGNPTLIRNVQKTNNSSVRISAEEKNEYAIENRKAEIKVRQKQSVFRRKVLSNFEKKCCLSDISEDLLIASHIVPWSKCIESRLDPANGLCLFTLYDQLFDQGFMTFTDELEVIITPKQKVLSNQLKHMLLSIEGKKARKPVEVSINPEYLKYHRNFVFQRV